MEDGPMSIRVVCISRTVAAGGERVGHLVAERLGFRYFDDEVIQVASDRAGLDAATVARAEGRSSLLTRLVDALTAPLREGESDLPKSEDRIHRLAKTHPWAPPPRDELRHLIQDAILEIARRGSAVIVAHAASTALANQKDVLRVFVTASPRIRTQRLYLGGSLLTEEEAAHAVAESDRERRLYLERFYDVSEELPTHYDLLVNTDLLDVEQAVGAIVGAATVA
jgi:cytidylate kinase